MSDCTRWLGIIKIEGGAASAFKEHSFDTAGDRHIGLD